MSKAEREHIKKNTTTINKPNEEWLKKILDHPEYKYSMPDVENVRYYDYSDMFEVKNGRNDFSPMSEDNMQEEVGIYIFASEGKSILYIGATAWGFCDRCQQHFRNGKNSFSSNLNGAGLEKLSASTLWLVPMKEEEGETEKKFRRRILFYESFLIGVHRPPFNLL